MVSRLVGWVFIVNINTYANIAFDRDIATEIWEIVYLIQRPVI